MNLLAINPESGILQLGGPKEQRPVEVSDDTNKVPTSGKEERSSLERTKVSPGQREEGHNRYMKKWEALSLKACG